MAYIELFERKGVAANMYLRKFLVSSESDLASLPKDCAPGSVAHTSGYVNRWELGIDGVWTKIPEGSSVDVSYMLDSDNGLPYIQEVYVETVSDFEYRRNQQVQAHSHLDAMLSLIDLAYTSFGIEPQRIEHWTGLVLKADDRLKNWMKSDKARYKTQLSLG